MDEKGGICLRMVIVKEVNVFEEVYMILMMLLILNY